MPAPARQQCVFSRPSRASNLALRVGADAGGRCCEAHNGIRDRTREPGRIPGRVMLTAFPWHIALLGVELGGLFGPPPGATLQARQVHALWAVFFFTAVGVAAVVYGLIFWSIIKYRKRSDELPPQFRENVPLEIAYTAIPLLIVAGLFILTYRTEGFVDRVASGADPPVTIRVTGFQWSWRFQYE